MADKNVTADDQAQTKTLEQIQFLEKDLEIVHATASCVEFALMHQDCEFDRAIALLAELIGTELHVQAVPLLVRA